MEEVRTISMSASSWKKAKVLKECDITLFRLSFADRKLTFKELATEQKDSAGVALSAPTVAKRCQKNDF